MAPLEDSAAEAVLATEEALAAIEVASAVDLDSAAQEVLDLEDSAAQEVLDLEDSVRDSAALEVDLWGEWVDLDSEDHPAKTVMMVLQERMDLLKVWEEASEGGEASEEVQIEEDSVDVGVSMEVVAEG